MNSNGQKLLFQVHIKETWLMLNKFHSPLTSVDLAKSFTTKARIIEFQMPYNYNAWSKVGGSGRPITTWTDPEDIVILINELEHIWTLKFCKCFPN